MPSKLAITSTLLVFTVLTAGIAVSRADTPQSLTLELKARDIDRGETNFSDSVSAAAGDRIQFQATVTAGALPIANVILKNNMPAGLVFSTGEDVNSSSGVNLGIISAGASKTATFELLATTGANITVTDVASARADNINEKTDSVSVSIGSTASDARNLSVKNTVRNVTRGETTGRSATTANPGDRIHIDIEVEALGNASQTEVEARYTLPSRLALASGDPNLLVNSISLGNMSPGAKKTLSFEATALSGDAVTVLPEARVKSSEVPEKKSQATIFIRGGDVASNRPSTTFDSSNTFPGPSPAPTPASAVAGAATGQRVSVINKTLNADAAAVGARPGEVLLVSLTSVNSTASAAEQAVQADVRDLMMLSQITNTGSPAGVVDNGIIKFPSATLTPGSTVTRTFEATILPAGQILTAADRTIVLAYGNTVSVNVDPNSRSSSVAGAATGPIVPPRTGASENTAILLSFLTTAGYWLIRNSKFQITNPK